MRVATNASCTPSPLVAQAARSPPHGSSPSLSCWAAVSEASVRTAPIYGADLDGRGLRRVYRHTALSGKYGGPTASTVPAVPAETVSAYGFAWLRNYPTSGYQATYYAYYTHYTYYPTDLSGYKADH